MLAKWQTMSECRDNQEVGLEAATLKRVRNSSLVEWCCADNDPGLKSFTEAADVSLMRGVVGERRRSNEGAAEACAGATTSANVGMSNVQEGCEPPPPKV